jgi:hypothetical protein
MIIRKLTEPLFIFFSKMYIHFYEDKRDYWLIFPTVILATLFTINIQTISFFLLDKTEGWHYVCLGLFFVLFFNLLFIKTKYEYVKNYKMSNKIKVIICASIIIDLTINFICVDFLRNEKLLR